MPCLPRPILTDLGNSKERTGIARAAGVCSQMSTYAIVALTVLGTVLVLFLLCFLGVLFLRRKHPRDVTASLSKITGAFHAMEDGLHFFWCSLLIYFWKGRFYMRKFVPWVVLFTFIFAGASALAEVVLKGLDLAARRGFAPTLTSPAAKWISQILLGAKQGLGAFYEHPVLLAVLLICELLIIWHHIREHRHRDRERKLVDSILDLFHPLNKVCVYLNRADKAQVDEAARAAAKNGAIETFLQFFSEKLREIFKERGVQDINVCVMLVEAGTEDLLVTFESSGGKDIERGFRLAKGKGAAGRSVQENRSIYVPNVKYEHAVCVTDHVNEVLTNVYEEGSSPFKSIVCTPILVTLGADSTGTPGEPLTPASASKTVGVLNLASRHRSPFSEFDLTVARLAARILSLMYNQGVY